MLSSLLRLLLICLLGTLPLQGLTAPFENTLAQRLSACTACHGKQGRAGPDGYYPRLAGKPAGYLYNQLLNFRDGRRHYELMTGMVEPLTDSYLMEIAQYFSAQEVPYPPPLRTDAAPAVLARGRVLALQGDADKKLPACVQCHGQALMGVAPQTPGLLGLPRDYLNAQLGGWQTGQRRAQAPDCMAHVAQQLSGADVAAVSQWLASQVVPAHARPATSLPAASANAGPTLPRCANTTQPTPTALTPSPPAVPGSARLSPGAYLARVGNCMGCHTAPGGVPYAGGRKIATPFGSVFSSNLTPDAATGLGRWSADDFWQALHHGRAKDGRLLNPAFPYTSFTEVTRSDADVLFTYLQSLPAQHQPNEPHALRWPFGTQAALTVWRTLYFTPGDYQPQPAQGADWNRGAYLVRGLGHCGACHTPRNALGASLDQQFLAGGKMPGQNWYAPSLRAPQEAGVTPDMHQHSLDLLQTGSSAMGTATGPMAEVVRGSTQYLSGADLHAVSLYLQSLPETTRQDSPHARQGEASKPAPARGAKLYEAHCVQCHGAQGEGVQGAYPPLAHNRAVTLNDPGNLIQMVLYGGFPPATQGQPRPFGMPPFVLQLNDTDTASVLTYIRNSWGNQAPQVMEIDVNRARGQP